MYEHANRRIEYVLNEVSSNRKPKVEELVNSFLPEDHDDLLNAFDVGYAMKNAWEEYTHDYSVPARIVMGLALIRLDSPKIRSVLIKDLLSKDEKVDPKEIDKYFHRSIAAIYIAGQGPYQNDQEVLAALHSLLGQTFAATSVETFRLFIPVLGTPVTKYYKYELAGFSLVNLGDLSMLDEILFGQLTIYMDNRSKDDFVKWVYSIDKSATVKALNSIASYNRTEHKDGWNPDFRKMISALEAIGAPECIEPLGRLFEQNDSAIRIRALEAIGNIGGENALVILRKATEDKKFNVRRHAKKIFKRME